MKGRIYAALDTGMRKGKMPLVRNKHVDWEQH
jgi:hypothetical protein